MTPSQFSGYDEMIGIALVSTAGGGTGSRTASSSLWAGHSFILALLGVWLLGGCATKVPVVEHRTVSQAFSQPETTTLGRFFAAEIAANPGHSGMTVLNTGETSFRARAGLANLAEQTIDAQYYIWDTDTSGSILAERVLRAADRSVRVRLLIDHVTTKDTDFRFARMDEHPNIEIRLFNPFANRSFRELEMAFSLKRLNHRMHNKAFIVDNAIAIVGGRNIGDNYFGVDTAANYRDLDLAMAGPIVQDISDSFDMYWNSDLAIPISSIIEERMTEDEFASAKSDLYRSVQEQEGFPYPIDMTGEALLALMNERRGDLIWAPARALYDEPDKLDTSEEKVADVLIEIGDEQNHEIVLESAYVVPTLRGTDNDQAKQLKGVRRRLLTNSLATNDVLAVHGAYARSRRELLKNGVELYELRPDAPDVRQEWSLLAGRSRASLHTKAIVADRKTVVIGSFNLDPRSIALNTEIVIIVESTELAEQVLDYLNQGVSLENSYRVMLEVDEETGADRLVWVTEIDGEEVRYYSEPEVSTWQRFTSWAIGLLPIREHL
jgi:putative cardiolipin synthase